MTSQAAGVAIALRDVPNSAAMEPDLNSPPQHDGDSNDSSVNSIPIYDEKFAQQSVESMNTNSTAQATYKHNDTSREEGLLYRKNGELVLIPAPTTDPKDPINLPLWHKLIGLFCLCLFGALAASAELILGAMLPVFALQYAGVNPKVLGPLTSHGGFPQGSDLLDTLQKFPGSPPIWKTYLLGSLPVLMMGVANLFLIPLSIAIGRRAVMLFCGVLAVAGACWAGSSQSLGSHLGARCIQAFGAGTVESLIPFIIQDIVYFHQRNFAISTIFAAQGSIIIVIGIACPYIILNLSWRWVYFITAIGAGFFLIGVFFFMPETRWHRTKDEHRGIPRSDEETSESLSPRTIKYNLALRHGQVEWRKGCDAFMDSLRTFFYPHICFITLLSSAMIAATLASAYTVAPALLTVPYSWKFIHLGFCLFPVLIAAGCVALITGNFADRIANFLAKRRGRRLPENQLINLILPTVAGIVGSALFGLAGDNPDKYPWSVLLVGLGLMSFGFLGANTVGAVYVLECYPQLAGPSLVNIASFRLILAFVLSFKVSIWIVDFGYLRSFMIYTGVIFVFALLLPVVYIWGPAWRRRWPGPDR